VPLDQRGEGTGPDQRQVAVEHDDGALGVGRQRDPHRVPGAVLPLLAYRLRLRRHVGEMGTDLVGAVTDHDDGALRAERRGGGQYMADEGTAEQRVQHLRQRRLHPLALTGGEDDDGTGHALLPFASAVAPGAMVSRGPW
jgi:hypothetical protein